MIIAAYPPPDMDADDEDEDEEDYEVEVSASLIGVFFGASGEPDLRRSIFVRPDGPLGRAIPRVVPPGTA